MSAAAPGGLGGRGGRVALPASWLADATRSLAPVSRLGAVCWRVDYTLSSSELREVNEPLVHLTFTVRDGRRGGTETVPMAVSANKFRVLLAGEAGGGTHDSGGGAGGAEAAPPHPLALSSELKQAQALMNTLL